MTNKQVLITVTLPVYNAMPLLTFTVESVLNQSYSNFEFIIIDDGSTDNSYEYLSTLTDKRIKLIKRDNRGLGYTLNQLFSLANTKYVVRMDADDICHKDRLKYQLKFMESNPDIVMSGTRIHFICDDVMVSTSQVLTEHDSIVEKLLLKRFSLCHPSLIIRLEAFNQVGGYKIKGAGEDLDFFLRMSEVGRLANIHEDLLGYRLSFSSLSMSNRSELHLGYDYAIESYRCRAKGIVEPEFSDFSQNHSSLRKNILNYFDGLSEQLYRRSIVFKSKNKIVKYIFTLSIAATFRPQTALFKIKKKLKNIF